MTDRALDRLSEREKAGRAEWIPAVGFRREVRRLESWNRLRSDDAQVLALARVSGARRLYTGDKALRDDFRDPEIVPRPRGKELLRREERAPPDRERLSSVLTGHRVVPRRR